jgi:prepilin-type N-terminal cleavage/methylation domain-containing protein
MGLKDMNFLNQKGFTLVELMIALLLSSLVLAAVGVAFRSQQKSYTAQEEVAEMQQELRAGMEIITRELRNAGHDMTPNKTAGAGFVAAGPFQVEFTMDLGDGAGGNPDGDINDPNEQISYGLRVDAANFENDGEADAGVLVLPLGRRDGPAAANIEALTSNIHAIGFAYAYDGPGPGAIEVKNVGAGDQTIWAIPDGAGGWTDLDSWPLPDGDGVIDVNDAVPGGLAAPLSLPGDETQLRQIRAVRIWILARSSRPDPDYTDTNTYKVGANVIAAPNDNFRRRLLTANVRFRNIVIVVK